MYAAPAVAAAKGPACGAHERGRENSHAWIVANGGRGRRRDCGRRLFGVGRARYEIRQGRRRHAGLVDSSGDEPDGPATVLRLAHEERHSHDLRRPGRAGARQAGGGLGDAAACARGNLDRLRGRPDLHLQPAQGRQFPRRHAVQRRGGEVELRPLLRPGRAAIQPGRRRLSQLLRPLDRVHPRRRRAHVRGGPHPAAL